MPGVLQLREWGAAGIRLRIEGSQVDPIQEMLSGSDERIVYDLRVGMRVQRGPRQNWQEMPTELRLKPGECIRVSTFEKLYTPNTVIGLICSRSSLAADGLYVSNIKVDPQFGGWLEVAVFNASRDHIIITKGMRFASIMFLDLREPLTENLPRVPTETTAVRRVGFVEKTRRSAPFIITGILSIGGSMLAQGLYDLIARL
jgi:deoxycytidine triphosphate deaminase